MKKKINRSIIVPVIGLSASLLSSSYGAVILQSNDFGAGADVGPALQALSNGRGGSFVPTTGVIITGADNASAFGANSASLVDVTGVAGATGFTVNWVVTSISDVTATKSNDMFLGVTNNSLADGDGLYNNSTIAYGIRVEESGLSFIGLNGTAIAPTVASMNDGFAISFTINDDETWSASSTGLSTNISQSNTLTSGSYAAIAGNLGANTSIQGNTISYTVDSVTITAIPEPSSTALLGLGGLALIFRRRK